MYQTQKNGRSRGETNESRVADKDESDVLSPISAFVQSAVKQKIKLKNNKTDTKHGYIKNLNKPAGSINNNVEELNSEIDDMEGFTTVLRDKNGSKYFYEKSSVAYHKRGYEMILRRQKSLAIPYFSRAIEFDPTDMRHYINRSYCYLNTGAYSAALQDIHRIITHTDCHILLSQMKCREGQALWGMENYEGAMQSFEESLNFKPECIAIKCEIMRMKVIQLTRLGFPEREVLELLQGDPEISIKDAVTILTLCCTFKCESNDRNEDGDDEDIIFHSDTEEYPSNTSIFMNIIGFDNEHVDNSWHRDAKNAPPNNCGSNITQSRMKITTKKVIDASAVPKSSMQKTVDKPDKKSVWVGNINWKITDGMLTNYFARFGKVSSVQRRKKCAFVTFQNANSVKSALNIKSIKICDRDLPIKGVEF